MNGKTWGVLVIGAIAVVPLVAGTLWTQIFLLTGFYAICVLGLSLLIGHAGLVSLAQAGFWGIGAYVSSFLAIRYGVMPILGAVAGMVAAGVIAAFLGYVTRNLASHYLTLVTLGAGMILQYVFHEEAWLTGGPSGLYGIPPFSLFGIVFDSDQKMYYLVWAVFALLLWLIRNLIRSPWGQTLHAVRDSQVAAASMGVHTAAYKVQAFVISGVLAALSGSLYAHYMTFVSPELFGLKKSIEFLLMSAIGGSLALTGPIWGALLLTGMTELLRSVLVAVDASFVGPVESLVYGVLLVIVILFLPGGLATWVRRWQVGRNGVR